MVSFKIISIKMITSASLATDSEQPSKLLSTLLVKINDWELFAEMKGLRRLT